MSEGQQHGSDRGPMLAPGTQNQPAVPVAPTTTSTSSVAREQTTPPAQNGSGSANDVNENRTSRQTTPPVEQTTPPAQNASGSDNMDENHTTEPLSQSAGTATGTGSKEIQPEVESETMLTCPENAVPWFQDIFPVINDTSLGKSYEKLLWSYMALEAGYGWQTGSTHLSAKGRPQKITAWINNGRKSFVLESGNCEAFAEQWWKWWLMLQPKWRGVDPINPLRPLPVGETTFGDKWGLLKVPGKNGLLTVVAGIWAWGIACAQRNDRKVTKDWESAVQDCTFMVNGLREYEN